MEKDGISVREILMIMQSELKIQILRQLLFVQDTGHVVSEPVFMSVQSADKAFTLTKLKRLEKHNS